MAWRQWRITAGWIAATLLLGSFGATPGLAQQEPGPQEQAATTPAAIEIDLSSPRQTMRTFLGAMNEVNAGYDDAWPAALATLDADDQPETDRQAAARRLKDLIDRLGVVKLGQLPGAHDVEASGRTDGRPIRRYVFFPRESHAWVWDRLGTSPEGQIVLASDEQGAWRFDRHTLVELDALYESLRQLPPRYDPRVADAADAFFTTLGPTFAYTPWWAWAALLAAIFLGLLAGKIAQGALNSASLRLERRGWLMRAAFFRDAASPASLALLSLGVMAGLRFVHMDEPLAEFSWKIITLLYIVALGWLLYNLVELIDLALRQFAASTESKLDDMIVPLVRKSLRIFLVIVFALVIGQNVFGLNITGFLAGLGIAGLAISLAAQDSVKNLFGSLTVFFDKPFAVGDFIVFNGETGTVEEIGFRSTRLRLLTGHVVTLPNMQFIDQKVENISRRPFIRRTMNVTITYDTPPQKIEEAVQIVKDILHDPEVMESGRFDMDQRPPRVAFNDLNADSLNIQAIYWYELAGDPDRGFFTWMDHCQIVNLKLFRAFEQAGIDFAFPSQTLYLANDDKRQLAVRLLNDPAAPSNPDN